MRLFECARRLFHRRFVRLAVLVPVDIAADTNKNGEPGLKRCAQLKVLVRHNRADLRWLSALGIGEASAEVELAPVGGLAD